jgi:hypothetical protein
MQPMPQHEYKIFSGMAKTTKMGRSIDWSTVEQQLDALIAQGWEVVSANASGIGLMVFGCGSIEPAMTFTLRRPRQS